MGTGRRAGETRWPWCSGEAAGGQRGVQSCPLGSLGPVGVGGEQGCPVISQNLSSAPGERPDRPLPLSLCPWSSDPQHHLHLPPCETGLLVTGPCGVHPGSGHSALTSGAAGQGLGRL